MNEQYRELAKRSRSAYRSFLSCEESGDKAGAVRWMEVLEDIETELNNLKLNTLEDDQ